MRTIKSIHKALLLLVLLLMACTRHPSVPTDAADGGRTPAITPDYVDVTLPPNIAPINFAVNEDGQECVVRITAADVSYTCGHGMNALIDPDEWTTLLQAAKGDSMSVEVFVRRDGHWTAFQPFAVHVANDSIDPYISYRMIPPSYVVYGELSIRQRSLADFDERVIYSNHDFHKAGNGQCINCHSYQNYGTRNMLFHMRQYQGGTMIVHDGNVQRVDLNTDSTISAAVYPAWHPTLPLVAFSTNHTGQVFHTRNRNKVEVQDTESDLVIYDVEQNTLQNILKTDNQLEIFPSWAPDGRTLYYCSSAAVVTRADSSDSQTIDNYKNIKYDIYAIDFDQQQRNFSQPRLVYAASHAGQSATLPRISPDGRWLVFAQAEYGCFHVWHNDADIYMIDLKTDTVCATVVESVNSDSSESYPTFSSNGRWLMFASRRDDGNYTRPYIAHFDPSTGRCTKPFELPQRQPNFYTFCTHSYNRPEFMTEPVSVKQSEFLDAAQRPALRATFRSRTDSPPSPKSE